MILFLNLIRRRFGGWMLLVSPVAGGIKESGNYLYSSWTADHAASVIETPKGSNFNYPASPFTSDMDASAGYFPIDLTVVTNGAGADYDTKYWIQKN